MAEKEAMGAYGFDMNYLFLLHIISDIYARIMLLTS
jgi:hypothetical protein